MGSPSAQRAATRAACLVLLAVLAIQVPLTAQTPGEVLSQTKITEGSGLVSTLASGDHFGAASAAIGDVDGDTIGDLAVGAPDADDGAADAGAIFILLLNGDGTVKAETRISATSGGFGGVLMAGDRFGAAIGSLGDLDGDGRSELAVGAPGDDDGAAGAGAVWVLSLAVDGSVVAQQKISATSGSFGGTLSAGDGFGTSVAGIGDLDGNGKPDMAVGAAEDDEGGVDTGAVWIVFMDDDYVALGEAKIGASSGDLVGPLAANGRFGSSVARLGDLDDDGVLDIAVGARLDAEAGPGTGAVWVLFLAANGTVKGEQKITSGVGDFAGALSFNSQFGAGLTAMGDLNEDGHTDLGVGAVRDNDGGQQVGALWVLFLDTAGLVTSHVKVSATSGGFAGALDSFDLFGGSIAALGDLDGVQEGEIREVAVGATQDDDGDFNAGAVWMLSVVGESDPDPFVPLTSALQGRSGRPVLVLVPESGPGGDIPGFEPQVPSPDLTGDTVAVTELSVLDGEGHGDFFLQGQYGSGQRPSMVQQGELVEDLIPGNGGGLVIPDLVVANNGSDSFTLLPGLADGTYDESVPEFTLLPDNREPVVIAVGDVDGDLQDDVIVGGTDGVSVFIGDGQGGFSAPIFTPLTLLTDLKLGFVDGDSNLDVVTTSGNQIALPGDPETGFASLLLGNGDGTFTTSTFATDKAMASVLLGALDAGPTLDALITVHEFGEAGLSDPTGRIELYLGDGAGAFSLSTDFGGYADVDPDGVHPTYGALGDLNGDGRLDAVYTSSDNVSHPAEDFADQQPPLTLTILLSDDTGLVHGDFDVVEQGTAYVGKGVEPLLQDYVPVTGDGILDAIVVWSEDGSAGLGGGSQQTGFQTFLALFVGDGLGNLIDPDPNQFLTGDEPGNPDLGSIDGGGADGGAPNTFDLLVPNVKGNSLATLFGDGEGAFVNGPVTLDVDDVTADNPPNELGIWQGGPLEARLVDLNGDADIDAVSYNQWIDLSGLFDPVASLSLFLGDGSGAFTRTDYVVVRAGDIDVADMTGDLVNDIVVTSWRDSLDDGVVSLYAGQGDGTLFTPSIDVAVSAGRRLSGGILIADADGVGDLDVFTTALPIGGGPGDLLVFQNNAGTLTENVFPLDGEWNSIRSIDRGDVSGDGAADYVLGALDGQLFVVTGPAGTEGILGPFTQALTNQTAAQGGGGAIRVAELNGDDALDIVSSRGVLEDETGQASVRRLLGLGSSFFSVEPFGGVAAVGDQGALRPVVADLDGDGAEDVVLPHGTSGTISVVKNALASWEAFGDGKAGFGGQTPELDGIGYTVREADIEFVLSNGLGGSPGILLFGIGKEANGFSAIDVVLGQFNIMLDGTFGVAGDGDFSLQVTIPDLPNLVGVEIVMQAVVLEFNQLSASNGLAFTTLQ